MELKVLEVTKKETNLANWTKYKIEPPEIITSGYQCWGIDPGSVHTGIAIIPYDDGVPYINIYQIIMPRWENPIDRILRWHDVLGELPLLIQGHCRMVIEGPAYAARYRQIELEQIRTSTVFWAHRLGIDTKIVQPSQVWKAVCGSGRTVPSHYWYLKDAPDALAALACAYYASNHWEENETK